jgi:NitT/TauT family transport system ATP-binding protein
MIQFDNVSKSFPGGSGGSLPVLANLNLSIQKGEFLCVLGPSGCGKTTFLNLIAGFVSPSKGRVLFQGKDVTGPGPERGVVFQDATLFPWLTVIQNVEFGLKIQGMKGRTLVETAFRFLESLGLAEHSNKFPYALSGGMRQRVAIARVLALEPKVLLMDEPFSALDANTRERLQDELLRIWMTYRKTVVYVTHSVEEAAYLADRIVIFGDTDSGGFTDMAAPQKRPRNRSSKEFLAMKDSLRECLAAQPCCIQPQTILKNLNRYHL